MHNKLKMAGYGVVLATGLGLLTSAAQATPYYEIPDAGHTFDTAQGIDISVDQIIGNLANDSPEDFADIFWIQWGGGLFTAETTGANFDTELFLWSMDQTLIDDNDDGASDGNICDDDDGSPGDDLCSLISEDLAPGHYFLGIGVFDTEAFSGGIEEDGVSAITAPGLYTIQLNTHTQAKIPTPGTLALLGFGLAGLGLRRRKRA